MDLQKIAFMASATPAAQEALAALVAQPEDVLLVMPSDHVIENLDAFHSAIRAALPMVSQGWLATFGIAADKPETGYGWIQVGDQLAEGVHRVARFVEKPKAEVKVDPDISRLEQRLAERLGSPVQIKHGQKGKGQLVIRYSSLDELQGVLAHIR